MAKDLSGKRVRNAGWEKLFDVLGEILAFCTVVVYALLIINANFSFIAEGVFLRILVVFKTYASLALLIVVGLEATVKRRRFIRIIFYVLAAIVIIFQFFPGTWEAIMNAVM